MMLVSKQFERFYLSNFFVFKKIKWHRIVVFEGALPSYVPKLNSCFCGENEFMMIIDAEFIQ